MSDLTAWEITGLVIAYPVVGALVANLFVRCTGDSELRFLSGVLWPIFLVAIGCLFAAAFLYRLSGAESDG